MMLVLEPPATLVTPMVMVSPTAESGRALMIQSIVTAGWMLVKAVAVPPWALPVKVIPAVLVEAVMPVVLELLFVVETTNDAATPPLVIPGKPKGDTNDT